MDSGGGPTLQSVAEMFSLLMDWPLVDVIVTSRFGGISSCDIFIRGLVDCLRKRHAEGRRVVPIYGRMVGTDLSCRAGVPRNRPPPDARATGQSVDGRRQPGNHGGGHSQRHRRLPRPKGSSIMSSTSYIPVRDGMLAYLVGKVRPALAARIAREGRIETAVIGLGKQGTRHAALMKEFGTTVAAAVAAEKGGSRVAESIPVYNTVADMLAAHPHIAAASIWKHYSTAAEATIEAIEAGIPILVLISEGMPVRDVQRVLAAARQHDTLLLGPNTPGVIFPPERVKVGMLPDVFQPAEPEPDRFTAEGVTICSRSGAILYHMSDALASVGIAQNAVIGVGGDSVIGTPFSTIVPWVMAFPGTHLVVVAGEIGGCLEEMLAEDMRPTPRNIPSRSWP